MPTKDEVAAMIERLRYYVPSVAADDAADMLAALQARAEAAEARIADLKALATEDHAMIRQMQLEVEAAEAAGTREQGIREAADLARDGTKCRVCGRVQMGYASPLDCAEWEATRAAVFDKTDYVKAPCNFDRLQDDDLAAAILALLPTPPVADAARVPLSECPEGLFMWDGCLCVMTEYSRDAYLVKSGEYFWGGTKTPEARLELMVTPIGYDAALRALTQPQEARDE